MHALYAYIPRCSIYTCTVYYAYIPRYIHVGLNVYRSLYPIILIDEVSHGRRNTCTYRATYSPTATMKVSSLVQFSCMYTPTCSTVTVYRHIIFESGKRIPISHTCHTLSDTIHNGCSTCGESVRDVVDRL